jgi:hypothetical protein
MIKDSHQKNLLCKHFYSLGWFAQPEVIVFHKGGTNEHKRVITDIDVLAIRPGTNLSWEMILGDCKTLKGQSPANRALWLKGLMIYLNASEGVLILNKEQGMEVDHKLFASSLNVTLLNEDEFDEYDKAIHYPSGSSNYSIDLRSIQVLRSTLEPYQKLKPYMQYLYELSWNENSFIEIIRKLIGESQQISQEIDPNKKEHLALIFDACAIFSIGIAECSGIIFKQYLKPQTKNQLDESLKYLIWGGRSQYEFVSKLRNELILARKGAESQLTLPEWDRFLHLIRNILEYPSLAFSLPIMFRHAAIDTLQGKPFLNNFATQDNLLLLKFGMLVNGYLCRAAKFPAQAYEIIDKEFINLQSVILTKQESESTPTGVLTESNNLHESEAREILTQKKDEEKLPKIQNNRTQPELPLGTERD